MAKIITDKEIFEKLIGTVISCEDYKKDKNSSKKYINPHGIELRLGNEARFLNTSNNSEKRTLKERQYLILKPGDSALVSSYESINFSKEISEKLFKDKYLMGLIHPTTTMMREGVSQVSTKIDTGFQGDLNWMIRNNSGHEIVVGYKEPLYKLSVFLLDKDEQPEKFYGENPKDQFQHTKGIFDSIRTIPAHIPEENRIELSVKSDDLSREKLREQGYPFNQVAQEFQRIDGEFEAVHKRIDRLEDRIKEAKDDLTKKIEGQTSSISGKIKESESAFDEKLEQKFEKWSHQIQEIIMSKVDNLVRDSQSKTIAILMAGMTFLASMTGFVLHIASLPKWVLPVSGMVLSVLILIVWKVLFSKNK